jgi:hypothetical protein
MAANNDKLAVPQNSSSSSNNGSNNNGGSLRIPTLDRHIS